MSVSILIQNSIDIFQRNVLSIYNLTNFHSDILEGVEAKLQLLSENLTQHAAVQRKVLNILTDIKNISTNPSHKQKADIIYNQTLVLLVSYFGDTVEEVFTKCFVEAAQLREAKGNDKDDEIKISIRELINREYELKEYIGEVVAEQKQINFQNIESVITGFFKYFNIKISKGTTEYNNIRAGQSFRHAIVHNGAKIDQKLIDEIAQYNPRSIKDVHLKLDEQIVFTIDEIRQIAADMSSFLENLKDQLIVEPKNRVT